MATTNLKYKGLNNPTRLTSADDMDNILVPGFYYQEGSNAPNNCPPNGPYNAAIIVIKARTSSSFRRYRCSPPMSAHMAFPGRAR